MDVRLNEFDLRNFSENILRKAGLSAEDAYTVTDSLLFANLRGIDSHGIARLPFYVRRLENGGTKPVPRIRIVQETAGTATVDGDDGMGQVVSVFAAELAVRKARETGIAFVGVRKSCHNGALSYYSIKMAKAGMIGISISNTTPVMAAWGGRGPAIGNNPMSVAALRGNGSPLVLDMAMSRVAGGKVRLAAKNGQKIPEGWIVDAAGQQTENPHHLTNGGALLPFGEHKGFALAIMMEVLSGAITGSGMLSQIPFWLDDSESSLNIGHSFVAIHIGSLMDPKEFGERVDWLANELKRSPAAEGSPGIFMPGEWEWQTAQERKQKGIAISPEVLRDLQSLAQQYGESLEVSSL